MKPHENGETVHIINTPTAEGGFIPVIQSSNPAARESVVNTSADTVNQSEASFMSPPIAKESMTFTLEKGTRQINTSSSCNCRKSHCLKLYCECFKSNKYCNACNCISCSNTKSSERERQEAIRSTLDRDPSIFEVKSIIDK